MSLFWSVKRVIAESRFVKSDVNAPMPPPP